MLQRAGKALPPGSRPAAACPSTPHAQQQPLPLIGPAGALEQNRGIIRKKRSDFEQREAASKVRRTAMEEQRLREEVRRRPPSAHLPRSQRRLRGAVLSCLMSGLAAGLRGCFGALGLAAGRRLCGGLWNGPNQLRCCSWLLSVPR
jgi:hypothetical protein